MAQMIRSTRRQFLGRAMSVAVVAPAMNVGRAMDQGNLGAAAEPAVRQGTGCR